MVDVTAYAGILAERDAILRKGIDRPLVYNDPYCDSDVEEYFIAGTRVVFDDSEVNDWWRR